MYIGRIMHTNLVTISPEATLVDAKDLVEKEKISHLLVVDDKEKLVGVLSEEDLKQNWASPGRSCPHSGQRSAATIWCPHL